MMLQQRCQLFLLWVSIVVGLSLAQEREAWLKAGADRLKEAVSRRPNVGVAKNVILFLGDGMGVSTVTATRILKGQMEGNPGEEHQLHMEKLPYTGLVKTYNTNQQTPDSAGTATAFLSGVKTRAGVLGVDSRVEKGDCTYLEEGSLQTMVDWALEAGKSVGIVTTARVTHATPGAAYAKIPHREWETDTDIEAPWYGNGGRNCDSSLKDIARQLVEDNHRIHVVMGGGRRSFMDKNATDPVHDKPGRRKDGRNLIKMWKAIQEAKGVRYRYVWNREQLKDVDDNVDHLLGLFDHSHMAYDADRYEQGIRSQPSLSEMTAKAINILRKNEKGYFLFVEGAAIDLGHHANLARKAMLEGIALDRAVKTATDLTREADTLTIVTADHSHVFNIAGYPVRGHPILGTMDNSNEGSWYAPTDRHVLTTLHYANGPGPNRSLDLSTVDTSKLKSWRGLWESPTDKLPMTSVVYGNGPGPGRELDLTYVDTTDLNFQFPVAVPIDYETHGGEDVALYAQGPMAHLLTGNWEQNYIAHVMAYAACIGWDKSHCTDDGREDTDFCNGGIRMGGQDFKTVRFTAVVLTVTAVALVRSWLFL